MVGSTESERDLTTRAVSGPLNFEGVRSPLSCETCARVASLELVVAELRERLDRAHGTLGTALGQRRLKCPACGELKAGWPDDWRNVSPEPRGLRYVCADCALTGARCAPGSV
jgi:hypothetical protein